MKKGDVLHTLYGTAQVLEVKEEYITARVVKAYGSFDWLGMELKIDTKDSKHISRNRK